MKPACKHSSGFTLLEVLVALCLLSLMAFSIIRITNQSTTTKTEVIKEDKDFLKAYSALYIMQKDFDHLYSPLYSQGRLNLAPMRPNIQATEEQKQAFAEFEKRISTQFLNNRRFSGYAENGDLIPKFIRESTDTITFMINGNQRKNLNENKSEFAWVTYTLAEPSAEDIEEQKAVAQKDDVKSGKNLVRYIDAKNPFGSDPTSQDDLLAQVLLEKVQSIEWKLWDRKRNQFISVENYSEELQPLTTIQVKLVFLDLYDQEQTLEKVFTNNFPERYLKKVLNSKHEAAQNTEGSEAPPPPGQNSGQGANSGDDND